MSRPLRPFLRCLVLGLLSLTSAPALASQTTPLEIRLAKDTPLTQSGRMQLQRILGKWKLDQWVFTRTVRIETGVIPHSHPVLTLNTQYVDNDTAQIANFVHEQLHWYFDAQQIRTDSAVARLKQMFPNAPAGPPEGARDLESTYLHLLVCLSEFNAMKQLFGEATARRTLKLWTHYAWIYREVLERPDAIQGVLRQFQLDQPDARKR